MKIYRSVSWNVRVGHIFIFSVIIIFKKVLRVILFNCERKTIFLLRQENKTYIYLKVKVLKNAFQI